MNTIVENLSILESIKHDIGDAIVQKGGSVTDAFGGYAQAIKDLPSGGGRDEQFEAAILNHTLSGVYSNSYVNYIGPSQFANCTNLTEVNFQNVLNVDQFAFSSCASLKSVYLPNATYFSQNVFNFTTNVTTLVLSDYVFLGSNAMRSLSKLVDFNIPKYMVIDSTSTVPSSILNTLSDANKAISSIYPTFSTASLISDENLYGITTSMVKSNKTLTEVNLPECWYIGSNAFTQCTNLQSVNLPMARYIGFYAFNLCPSIQYLDLPMANYISYSAFNNCSSIQYLDLPMARYIGHSAFNNCSKLSIITLLADSVCYIEDSSIFNGTLIKSTTGSIIVPASLVDAYKVADGWSYFKNRIFPYEG